MSVWFRRLEITLAVRKVIGSNPIEYRNIFCLFENILFLFIDFLSDLFSCFVKVRNDKPFSCTAIHLSLALTHHYIVNKCHYLLDIRYKYEA